MKIEEILIEGWFPHEGDSHLSYVVCKISNTLTPYAFYTRNHEFDSYNGGHYFEDKNSAIAYHYKRMNELWND